MKSILDYLAVFAVAVSLAGCMSQDEPAPSANSPQTEPLITNTPSPTADPSRTGSNLNEEADPNSGIVSPTGVPGNVGGR